MVGENGGGSTRPWLSMNVARTLCLIAVGGAAVLLLVWMYTERQLYSDLRRLQMEVGQKEAAHQGSAAQSGADSPVQVVVKTVELPTHNSTTPPPWDYNWDKKAWKKPEEAQGVGIRTIILVRHGQYDFNTGKLTELGRLQANLTGLRLRDLNMPYTEIIHSTMIRAEETASLIQGHVTQVAMTADKLLEEGGPVPPQPTVAYWGLTDRQYYVEGPRLEAAFRKYFYRADKEQTTQTFQILVGHANIFRFFALRALQLPPEAWMRVFIAHASISLFHINPDGTVSMTKFGDCGHFPPNMVTT